MSKPSVTIMKEIVLFFTGQIYTGKSVFCDIKQRFHSPKMITHVGDCSSEILLPFNG